MEKFFVSPFCILGVEWVWFGDLGAVVDEVNVTKDKGQLMGMVGDCSLGSLSLCRKWGCDCGQKHGAGRGRRVTRRAPCSALGSQKAVGTAWLEAAFTDLSPLRMPSGRRLVQSGGSFKAF